jgi:hypothetical protein
MWWNLVHSDQGRLIEQATRWRERVRQPAAVVIEMTQVGDIDFPRSSASAWGPADRSRLIATETLAGPGAA